MGYRNLELEIENLLSEVIQAGASDLHLVPGHSPILRIDGNLVAMDNREVVSFDYNQKIALGLMSEARYAVLEKQRDLDFSFSFKGNNRFRANAYYQKNVLTLAFRSVSQSIKSFEELNLPPSLQDFTRHKQGLVLVVGPTGHGKSTTLAAMLEHINKTRTEHIVTIEDPIEYLFTPVKSIIQQREVGSDTLSFSRAIRATLREDANVVMVGEMRDPDSMAAAITVAETGHLVFATLHTNDAAQTVDRIIDSFLPQQQQQIRTQIAATLTGIISQRLLKKIGGGMVPAVETLVANNAARNLIREGKTHELINVIHTGAGQKMISMDHSLAELVGKGLVGHEEARLYTQYPELFESKLKM